MSDARETTAPVDHADTTATATVPTPQPQAAEPPIRVIDRRWWAQPSGETGEEKPVSLKPTYVEQLERQLAEKDALIQNQIARYREAAREFDEARLRARRELTREIERAKRAILLDLLEVMDNLDRALEAARAEASPESLRRGVELVRQQFLAKLEALGVTRLDPLGQPFDPSLHEAVSTVPVDDPAKDQTVVGVIRPGYKLGDEVLRPATVAVGQVTPST